MKTMLKSYFKKERRVEGGNEGEKELRKNDNICRGKKEIEVFWLNRHRRLEQSDLNLQSHTLSPRVRGRVLQSDCHKKHTHCADTAVIELHVLFFFC